MMMEREMYKIKLCYGKWIEVAEYVFRSWTGERKLNDKPYNGPVYVLGTDKVAP